MWQNQNTGKVAGRLLLHPGPLASETLDGEKPPLAVTNDMPHTY